MSKKNVLVFPCGSEIGLEVHQAVHHSTHFELFGLSSVNDHGKYVYENYIDGIGFFTDSDFLHHLNSVIEKFNIDIIYPTMDSVITFLKKNENKLKAPIVGSCFETAVICESKLITYDILRKHVKCPVVYQKNDEKTKFPLFTKPIIGYGSRNVFKINTPEELLNINYDKQLVIEYLPGKEYTVDCFTRLNGELAFVGARERSRTVNGISVNTKTDFDLTKKFTDIANRINSLIQFEGSWFFQMKEDERNELTLLEISCRFAGSSSVHRIQGINFALANLYLKLGVNPEFILNDFDIELDRALNSKYKINIDYTRVYIDLDDTIIVNNKVNIDAISYIYQCRNNAVAVNLITKHADDLTKTLDFYKLGGLFDNIIHLRKDEEKYTFIDTSEKSLFIDDSFAERKKIFEKLSIPVFGVDAIKSLLK